jgi:pyruvate/2-oxoglutarate dehydrogenase complex dihydrolipoamide dehydrogenase (E3) component
MNNHQPDQISSLACAQALIDHVHPPDWTNPDPADRYHLVIIGGGPAGLAAATEAVAAGGRVALVEKNLLAGNRLRCGIPSKGVIRAGRAIRDARNAAEFGVINGERLTVDFATALERMHQVRTRISTNDSARHLRDDLGVDVYFGAARFSGPDTLEVEGKTLSFHRALVCTGSVPRIPPIPGLEESGCLTHETVFSLAACPERLTVIGGGPVGCELAQAFAYLGATVTLLNDEKRILPREDPEISEFIHNSLERDGIIIYNETQIMEAGTSEGTSILDFEQPGPQRFTLATDRILVATGVAPNVGGLDLEAAGVAYDPVEGIGVDNRLRTSNPKIYAAGDVACNPFGFTHAAEAMARIVVANALFGGRETLSGLVIPRCIHTTPEVAHVGLSRTEAEEQGIAIDSYTVPLAEVDRALLDGEEYGFLTAHVKKGTDHLLGATIVARNAGEMINEFTLAITAGIGLSTLAAVIHPYPTQGEAVKKLAETCNRARTAPGFGRVLAAWWRWKRN